MNENERTEQEADKPISLSFTIGEAQELIHSIDKLLSTGSPEDKEYWTVNGYWFDLIEQLKKLKPDPQKPDEKGDTKTNQTRNFNIPESKQSDTQKIIIPDLFN